MFVISQYFLNLSGTCKNINQISTYSIITGLVLYASIYLYLLFYNNEYLNIFNKFIIYIIIIDLLLSTFYYFNLQKSFKYSNDNSINIETYRKLNQNDSLDDPLDAQEKESDLESVDMSLIDYETESGSESDGESEADQSELHPEDQFQELQKLQHTQLQDLQHIQDTQDTQNIQNIQELENVSDLENTSIKLNEIDELLSIPIPAVKIKQKRGPKKKNNDLSI